MFALTPELLAPGDAKSASLDPAEFDWGVVRSAEDPLFSMAYETLWAEFGAAHELESREVLAGRFALGPAMRYEMVVVRKDGAVAAVRDHTAIWQDGEVIVHLSHNLVLPEWRRSGLAGWLRAAPLLAAHEVAAALGEAGAPITLVAEMEFDDGTDPRRGIRLAAYERAGFLKIDPVVVHYFQPDFRWATEIDATGAKPLPFQLLVRQIVRDDRTITGARVRRIVQALYALYGAQFRAEDMRHPALRLEAYPADEVEIALLRPTER
jgi:hypothetical protein